MRKREDIHHELHTMKPDDIRQAACSLLDELLLRTTISSVWQQTGITRTTLYKWQNESLPLDVMNVRDAAWFILVCETRSQLQKLLLRPPLQRPIAGKRLIEKFEAEST